MIPSNTPPQRAPPPPPLKLPLTDSEELQSRKKPQLTYNPYSQSERHQSKSSLDHELRQYQKYSERMHKLADSSVESLSYGKPRAETESSLPRLKQHSLPNTTTNESDKHQDSRQEQANLEVKASNDDSRSETIRGRENPEISSSPLSLSIPSISSGQHHSNKEPSSSGTLILLSPDLSTMQMNPSQSVTSGNPSLAQTKDHGGDKIQRKSNDSTNWYANSHNSSCSHSEEESQVLSANAVPPHSVITHPNPKIISIIGNQRRSEPTRNLSPVVLQPRGHHSASALGFGGPSDWEHFGNYEVEEIDDTDLYSRSKPETDIKIVENAAVSAVDNAAENAVENAAELPVEVTPIDKPQTPTQAEEVEPNGKTKELLYSTSQDIVSFESFKPENNFKLPKVEHNVDSPKSGLNVEFPRAENDVEPLKPEHSVESVEPIHDVEPLKSEPDVEPLSSKEGVEPLKSELSVESFKAEQKVESSKPGLNFESFKPENIVESPRSEKGVESFTPGHSVESFKIENNVEYSKPEFNVEPPKPEKSGEPSRPENNFESLKPRKSIESFIPKQSIESSESGETFKGSGDDNSKITGIESSEPEEKLKGSEDDNNKSTGIESSEPEETFKGSGDDNSKITGIEPSEPEETFKWSGDDNSKTTSTESPAKAKPSGSTQPQALHLNTEKRSPQRQNLDVNGGVKAWSDDSTRGNAHENQPTASSHLVDGEPSCDQSVKPSRESQIETLSSSDTSPNQPLDPLQLSQGDLLLNKLSSNQISTPLLAEEIPALLQTSQFQVRNQGKIDMEDGKFSSMSVDNTSEMKEINVNQVLPTDQVISRGIDVADGQIGQSKLEELDENITIVPIKPSDPTTMDRSSTSSTLCHRESTLHPSPPSKENKPLKSTGIENIYADLDPWGRASLHRYISMLHEEAKAKTDLEKFKAFTVFANRETKLRAVLYAVNDDVAIIQNHLPKDGPKDLAGSTAKRSEKALPALPPDGEHAGGQVLERPPEESGLGSKPAIMSDDVEISLVIDTPSVGPLYSTESSQTPPQETKDESSTSSILEVKTPRERVNKAWTQFASYIYPSQSSSTELPKIMVPENTAEPQKRAYIPYKYNQTEAEINNYLSKRQSAYRPYAALTMSSLDSGLCPITEPNKSEGTMAEPYISELQRESRPNDQLFEPTTSSLEVAELSKNDQIADKPDLRRFVKSDFDPLRSVLPSSGVIIQDSAELQELHGSMDAFPDDFSFIRECVLAWDAVAKKERECFERERHSRQGESERKIDELFDNEEIGYGDISILEAEFKQSEASRQADEDRHAYHTFLSNVFDVVWTQLHYEIDNLTPLYNKYMTLINDSLVGKDMFEVSTARFTLAPLMSALLALHQKLEVRHQKAFEAVLERDRRLKRTEISAWYTIGNVSKVKELEKQFEGAEKNALVAYCQHRDERANKLMDVLDQNTLRGMGANQDYMECLLKAVRRVASGRASTSIPSSDAGIGVEEVKKAKSITTALSTSSEQIVRTFHVADMLLNAADYELSVAKAKLANADAATFKQLKEERTKEDKRLMRDLELRLARIREDTRKTHDEVVKLLVFLGVGNGHSETANMTSGAITPSETQELVQRLLSSAQKIASSDPAHE